ncbi:MAG: hypothetical protein EFKGCFLK_02613 [Rhodocyclaceae bacterium]|nr:MAG: hypothetical protein F9K21_04560 [Rhodocyclaceae bacterium]MBV6408992.1 hypothetical protein [Rhodocyclaceae bacterium]CAG0931702.1 hypothetical protein RHDC3_01962 [Rhodocyclaceae bacterium]
MLVSLKRGYSNLVTSGGQLVLLVIGAKTESALGMFVCVALMVPLSLFAWTSAFRRIRAVDDTPTSRIASAAQGYVELIGTGKPLAGAPLISPCSHVPCLWYRYTVERRDSDNKWHTEERGESDASFILDDGSGECAVDPDGAEMLVTKKESWIEGDRRYTEWLLIERQTIYALGQFATRGSVDLRLSAAEDVKQLLAEWKGNPEPLNRRFDLDGDGRLDLKEWELARAQARREVLASHRELRTTSELHVLHLPQDGRHYLISDLDPAGLARRYRWWSWFHLAIFFAALTALPFLWHMDG